MKKSKIKVSVIIPVYNVEKYLSKCLDSVIDQTLKEIEIIVVNDGSTDCCFDIIKKYQKKDKRIIYLEQENQGQGSARNKGLKKASGEYITFVDSDDFIELNMLELMYNQAINDESDMVICDYYRIKEEIKEKCCAFYTKGNGVLENCILNTSGPCWKLIKRSLIIDNNLYFPEQIIYEDYAIVPIYVLFAEKVSYLDQALYNYLIRSGSTMTQVFNSKFYDLLKATDLLYKRLEELGFPYYPEYEYFIIKNIFREAYFRVKNFDEGKNLMRSLSCWAKKNMPYWYKNKYFQKESFKQKLYTYLIYKKQYKLLNIFHNLRK